MAKKQSMVYASRFAVIFLNIIIQVVAAWVLIYILGRQFWWINALTVFIGVILFFSIVNRDQPASYKLPWVIFFLIFPFAGLMTYITFGNVKVSKKQMKKITAIYHEHHEGYYEQERVLKKLESAGLDGLGQAKYIRNVSSLPVFDNSFTKYLPTGESFFDSLKESLSKAQKYVFLEYFIVEDGKMWQEIYKILQDRMDDGVEVYFMYDDVGSMTKVPGNFYKTLREEGVKAEKFNKFMPVVSISHNNRDHRKIAVIDGKVGYMSGANIADEYINVTKPFGRWRDNGVKIEGQAVDSLVRLFIQLYNMATKIQIVEKDFICREHLPVNDGFVLPFGDAPSPIDTETIGENIYLDIINRANDYVYITTPYLIVDTNILYALKNAAKRGVDVRIILPGVPDKKIVNIITRSNYPALLSAGVKIYHFRGGFIHSKTFLSDRTTAVVGTINLDYRSLVHHFECAVWLYKTSSINDIYADFCNLFEVECDEIKRDEFKLKPIERLIKSVVNIFAPLM